MTSIGVDAGFVIPGRVGGAEQMIANVVQGLRQACTPGDELTVFCDHPWPTEEAGAPVRWMRPRGSGNRFVRAWRTARAGSGRIDGWLFSNYFTPPVLGRGRPRIVTVIHDLQYIHLPENFSRKKRLWLRSAHEATLRLADAVVAVSDAVREDVLSRYGSRWADKVHAIPNPVSWNRFRPRGPQEDAPDGRSVLSVAAQYPHKNLATLLRAFAELRRRGAGDVRLVLAGQLGSNLHGIAWYPRIDALIDELGLQDAVRITGYVDDAELGRLYRSATLFVYPSLFEGFGQPPVEALGCGLPVLTTRCTSIPEVTLGLASYVEDPSDPAEMAERMAEILDAPDRYRPSATDVERLRTTYDPGRIGARYYRLLTAGVA